MDVNIINNRQKRFSTTIVDQNVQSDVIFSSHQANVHYRYEEKFHSPSSDLSQEGIEHVTFQLSL